MQNTNALLASLKSSLHHAPKWASDALVTLCTPAVQHRKPVPEAALVLVACLRPSHAATVAAVREAAAGVGAGTRRTLLKLVEDAGG